MLYMLTYIYVHDGDQRDGYSGDGILLLLLLLYRFFRLKTRIYPILPSPPDIHSPLNPRDRPPYTRSSPDRQTDEGFARVCGTLLYVYIILTVCPRLQNIYSTSSKLSSNICIEREERVPIHLPPGSHYFPCNIASKNLKPLV